MTKQDKINWLEQATGEEVLNEFNGRATWLARHGIEDARYFEFIEDYNLIRAELVKRLNRTEV